MVTAPRSARDPYTPSAEARIAQIAEAWGREPLAPKDRKWLDHEQYLVKRGLLGPLRCSVLDARLPGWRDSLSPPVDRPRRSEEEIALPRRWPNFANVTARVERMAATWPSQGLMESDMQFLYGQRRRVSNMPPEKRAYLDEKLPGWEDPKLSKRASSRADRQLVPEGLVSPRSKRQGESALSKFAAVEDVVERALPFLDAAQQGQLVKEPGALIWLRGVRGAADRDALPGALISRMDTDMPGWRELSPGVLDRIHARKVRESRRVAAAKLQQEQRAKDQAAAIVERAAQKTKRAAAVKLQQERRAKDRAALADERAARSQQAVAARQAQIQEARAARTAAREQKVAARAAETDARRVARAEQAAAARADAAAARESQMAAKRALRLEAAERKRIAQRAEAAERQAARRAERDRRIADRQEQLAAAREVRHEQRQRDVVAKRERHLEEVAARRAERERVSVERKQATAEQRAAKKAATAEHRERETEERRLEREALLRAEDLARAGTPDLDAPFLEAASDGRLAAEPGSVMWLKSIRRLDAAGAISAEQIARYDDGVDGWRSFPGSELDRRRRRAARSTGKPLPKPNRVSLLSVEEWDRVYELTALVAMPNGQFINAFKAHRLDSMPHVDEWLELQRLKEKGGLLAQPTLATLDYGIPGWRTIPTPVLRRDDAASAPLGSYPPARLRPAAAVTPTQARAIDTLAAGGFEGAEIAAALGLGREVVDRHLSPEVSRASRIDDLVDALVASPEWRSARHGYQRQVVAQDLLREQAADEFSTGVMLDHIVNLANIQTLRTQQSALAEETQTEDEA